jgi:hypothetical protein
MASCLRVERHKRDSLDRLGDPEHLQRERPPRLLDELDPLLPGLLRQALAPEHTVHSLDEQDDIQHVVLRIAQDVRVHRVWAEALAFRQGTESPRQSETEAKIPIINVGSTR